MEVGSPGRRGGQDVCEQVAGRLEPSHRSNTPGRGPRVGPTRRTLKKGPQGRSRGYRWEQGSTCVVAGRKPR